MTWRSDLVDRPALDGLKRISRSLAKRLTCLVCGESWNGSVLTAHACPACESTEVVSVEAA